MSVLITWQVFQFIVSCLKRDTDRQLIVSQVNQLMFNHSSRPTIKLFNYQMGFPADSLPLSILIKTISNI